MQPARQRLGGTCLWARGERGHRQPDPGQEDNCGGAGAADAEAVEDAVGDQSPRWVAIFLKE